MVKDNTKSSLVNPSTANSKPWGRLIVACAFVLLSLGYFFMTRVVVTALQSRGIATGSDNLEGILLIPFIALQLGGLTCGFLLGRRNKLLAQGLFIGVLIIFLIVGSAICWQIIEMRTHSGGY